MKRIVSGVPGRLRIKDSAFGDTDIANEVVARLKQLTPNDALLSTRINTGANSIVVHYDIDRLAPIDMQVRTEHLLVGMFGKSPIRRRRRSRRLRINRYAKIGALVSLAASLAFAATGHKRLHIIAGMVFLAFLTAHLAVFRRTLIH